MIVWKQSCSLALYLATLIPITLWNLSSCMAQFPPSGILCQSFMSIIQAHYSGLCSFQQSGL